MHTSSLCSPDEALARLLEGNRRFRSDALQGSTRASEERRVELLAGQRPFAALLTCSDSRLPPEYLFDVGLGDLFVVRTAGNLLDELCLGSLEYAVAHTGCPLVAVLGHTHCGAVQAALGTYADAAHSESPSLDAVVQRLLPAVLASRCHCRKGDDAAWAREAELTNVRMIKADILRRSEIIAERVRKGTLKVAGLNYLMESGAVEVIGEAF